MTDLKGIAEYVQTTAEVISSILDMQVIICDTDLEMLGDSYPGFAGEGNKLNHGSILTEVMKTGDKIVLKSCGLHTGCVRCSNRDKCNVLAIIGVPIEYKGIVVGSIGIIADSEKTRVDLLAKQNHYMQFIGKMSDLLLSKIEEQEKNTELKILKKRLVSIVDSIDGGLISLDGDGRVIHWNANIEKFLSVPVTEGERHHICDWIHHQSVKDLVELGVEFKNKEIVLTDDSTSTYALISGKTIGLDDCKYGYVIVFKELADVYNEVNALSNNAITTSFDQIIGCSAAIGAIIEQAKAVVNSKSTVLIQGESGTGKEVFARAIHYAGCLKEKPFIAINCATIPDNLLESELFGYDGGAFSGAKKEGKIGKLQLADGGTLFLDEIGELPLHLQAKLLRVLQERYIERLGSNTSIPIDVRVIAATNKELEKMVLTNEFREDLYYRLNVIPMHIPPLRERREDIPLLLEYFLQQNNTLLGKKIKGYSADALRVLVDYRWKGNVRELQNLVEYAVNMTVHDYIRIEDLPNRVSAFLKAQMHVASIDKQVDKYREEKTLIQIVTLEDAEKRCIVNALSHFGNDLAGKESTAKALGISRATLYRKIKLYNIGI